ncbi:creatininase family protein [Plantactinospora sp. S1510]|uniref:Creatininase family protein n=1 Tax=Plantactinospora alkalitolerans TaxID=2789879 RepID=A0ABS0GUR4_9ACTN|nr:creatininase family protein [Plantactinospora alkalitolerans]MBF9129684.1 creatininase family protein [Plantactinospora alkalitolerans]
MNFLLPTATSAQEAARSARTAVLPVGSFEQHGEYLPLITDTVVACLVAGRVAADYRVLLLPPITISCSHEHASFAGTVSISARTLIAVVEDIDESLRAAGVENLVIVNGHGGNYALRNVVQQSTTVRPRMALFPASEDWTAARADAGCETGSHEDMHGGELEVSLLLHGAPELLREGYQSADHDANDRPDLLTVGMRAYTASGIIGRPSSGSAQKGAAVLDSLSRSFTRVHKLLEL